MNREIKFRVWDKELENMFYNGKWVNNDSFVFDLLTGDLYLKDLEDNQVYKYHEQDRFIITEYTGLKDRNGKEIYEGDICLSEKQYKCYVEWNKDEASFYFIDPMDGKSMIDTLTAPEKVQVIGNIYENPELCEEK